MPTTKQRSLSKIEQSNVLTPDQTPLRLREAQWIINRAHRWAAAAREAKAQGNMEMSRKYQKCADIEMKRLEILD